MSNLKKINEYKRILQKLLTEEGLHGVKMQGWSRPAANQTVIRAHVAMDIRILFDGQKATVYNEELEGGGVTLNLADPISLSALKKIFNDDVQRILNGKETP